MITKEEKVTYKLKDVRFEKGVLVTEDGEVVDLMQDLSLIFGKDYFTLNVIKQNKAEYSIDHFVFE